MRAVSFKRLCNASIESVLVISGGSLHIETEGTRWCHCPKHKRECHQQNGRQNRQVATPRTCQSLSTQVSYKFLSQWSRLHISYPSETKRNLHQSTWMAQGPGRGLEGRKWKDEQHNDAQMGFAIFMNQEQNAGGKQCPRHVRRCEN
jgi:hypothetical protein